MPVFQMVGLPKLSLRTGHRRCRARAISEDIEIIDARKRMISPSFYVWIILGICMSLVSGMTPGCGEEMVSNTE
jgi:H+/Cl- antiporter ClcA